MADFENMLVDGSRKGNAAKQTLREMGEVYDEFCQNVMDVKTPEIIPFLEAILPQESEQLFRYMVGWKTHYVNMQNLLKKQKSLNSGTRAKIEGNMKTLDRTLSSLLGKRNITDDVQIPADYSGIVQKLEIVYRNLQRDVDLNYSYKNDQNVREDINDSVRGVIQGVNYKRTQMIIDEIKAADDQLFVPLKTKIANLHSSSGETYLAFQEYLNLRKTSISIFLHYINKYEQILKNFLEKFNTHKLNKNSYTDLLTIFSKLANYNGESNFLERVITATNGGAFARHFNADLYDLDFSQRVTQQQVHDVYKKLYQNIASMINEYEFLTIFTQTIAQHTKENSLIINIDDIMLKIIMNYFAIIAFYPSFDKDQINAPVQQLKIIETPKNAFVLAKLGPGPIGPVQHELQDVQSTAILKLNQINPQNKLDFQQGTKHKDLYRMYTQLVCQSIESVYGSFLLVIDKFRNKDKSIYKIMQRFGGAEEETRRSSVIRDAIPCYFMLYQVHIQLNEQLKNFEQQVDINKSQYFFQVSLTQESKFFDVHVVLKSGLGDAVNFDKYLSIVNKLWGSYSQSTQGGMNARSQALVQDFVTDLMNSMSTQVIKQGPSGFDNYRELKEDDQNIGSYKSLYNYKQTNKNTNQFEIDVDPQPQRINVIDLYLQITDNINKMIKTQYQQYGNQNPIFNEFYKDKYADYFSKIQRDFSAKPQDLQIIYLKDQIISKDVTVIQHKSEDFVKEVGVYLQQYMKFIQDTILIMVQYNKNYVQIIGNVDKELEIFQVMKNMFVESYKQKFDIENMDLSVIKNVSGNYKINVGNDLIVFSRLVFDFLLQNPDPSVRNFRQQNRITSMGELITFLTGGNANILAARSAIWETHKFQTEAGQKARGIRGGMSTKEYIAAQTAYFHTTPEMEMLFRQFLSQNINQSLEKVALSISKIEGGYVPQRFAQAHANQKFEHQKAAQQSYAQQQDNKQVPKQIYRDVSKQDEINKKATQAMEQKTAKMVSEVPMMRALIRQKMVATEQKPQTGLPAGTGLPAAGMSKADIQKLEVEEQLIEDFFKTPAAVALGMGFKVAVDAAIGDVVSGALKTPFRYPQAIGNKPVWPNLWVKQVPGTATCTDEPTYKVKPQYLARSATEPKGFNTYKTTVGEFIDINAEAAKAGDLYTAVEMAMSAAGVLSLDKKKYISVVSQMGDPCNTEWKTFVALATPADILQHIQIVDTVPAADQKPAGGPEDVCGKAVTSGLFAGKTIKLATVSDAACPIFGKNAKYGIIKSTLLGNCVYAENGAAATGKVIPSIKLKFPGASTTIGVIGDITIQAQAQVVSAQTQCSKVVKVSSNDMQTKKDQLVSSGSIFEQITKLTKFMQFNNTQTMIFNKQFDFLIKLGNFIIQKSKKPDQVLFVLAAQVVPTTAPQNVSANLDGSDITKICKYNATQNDTDSYANCTYAQEISQNAIKNFASQMFVKWLIGLSPVFYCVKYLCKQYFNWLTIEVLQDPTTKTVLQAGGHEINTFIIDEIIRLQVQTVKGTSGDDLVITTHTQAEFYNGNFTNKKALALIKLSKKSDEKEIKNAIATSITNQALLQIEYITINNKQKLSTVKNIGFKIASKSNMCYEKFDFDKVDLSGKLSVQDAYDLAQRVGHQICDLYIKTFKYQLKTIVTPIALCINILTKYSTGVAVTLYKTHIQFLMMVLKQIQSGTYEKELTNIFEIDNYANISTIAGKDADDSYALRLTACCTEIVNKLQAVYINTLGIFINISLCLQAICDTMLIQSDVDVQPLIDMNQSCNFKTKTFSFINTDTPTAYNGFAISAFGLSMYEGKAHTVQQLECMSSFDDKNTKAINFYQFSPTLLQKTLPLLWTVIGGTAVDPCKTLQDDKPAIEAEVNAIGPLDEYAITYTGGNVQNQVQQYTGGAGHKLYVDGSDSEGEDRSFYEIGGLALSRRGHTVNQYVQILLEDFDSIFDIIIKNTLDGATLAAPENDLPPGVLLNALKNKPNLKAPVPATDDPFYMLTNLNTYYKINGAPAVPMNTKIKFLKNFVQFYDYLQSNKQMYLFYMILTFNRQFGDQKMIPSYAYTSLQKEFVQDSNFQKIISYHLICKCLEDQRIYDPAQNPAVAVIADYEQFKFGGDNFEYGQVIPQFNQINPQVPFQYVPIPPANNTGSTAKDMTVFNTKEIQKIQDKSTTITEIKSAITSYLGQVAGLLQDEKMGDKMPDDTQYNTQLQEDTEFSKIPACLKKTAIVQAEYNDFKNSLEGIKLFTFDDKSWKTDHGGANATGIIDDEVLYSVKAPALISNMAEQHCKIATPATVIDHKYTKVSSLYAYLVAGGTQIDDALFQQLANFTSGGRGIVARIISTIILSRNMKKLIVDALKDAATKYYDVMMILQNYCVLFEKQTGISAKDHVNIVALIKLQLAEIIKTGTTAPNTLYVGGGIRADGFSNAKGSRLSPLCFSISLEDALKDMNIITGFHKSNPRKQQNLPFIYPNNNTLKKPNWILTNEAFEFMETTEPYPKRLPYTASSYKDLSQMVDLLCKIPGINFSGGRFVFDEFQRNISQKKQFIIQQLQKQNSQLKQDEITHLSNQLGAQIDYDDWFQHIINNKLIQPYDYSTMIQEIQQNQNSPLDIKQNLYRIKNISPISKSQAYLQLSYTQVSQKEGDQQKSDRLQVYAPYSQTYTETYNSQIEVVNQMQPRMYMIEELDQIVNYIINMMQLGGSQIPRKFLDLLQKDSQYGFLIQNAMSVKQVPFKHCIFSIPTNAVQTPFGVPVIHGLAGDQVSNYINQIQVGSDFVNRVGQDLDFFTESMKFFVTATQPTSKYFADVSEKIKRQYLKFFQNIDQVPEGFSYEKLDCFKKLPELPAICKTQLFGAAPIAGQFDQTPNTIFNQTVGDIVQYLFGKSYNGYINIKNKQVKRMVENIILQSIITSKAAGKRSYVKYIKRDLPNMFGQEVREHEKDTANFLQPKAPIFGGEQITEANYIDKCVKIGRLLKFVAIGHDDGEIEKDVFQYIPYLPVDCQCGIFTGLRNIPQLYNSIVNGGEQIYDIGGKKILQYTKLNLKFYNITSLEQFEAYIMQLKSDLQQIAASFGQLAMEGFHQLLQFYSILTGQNDMNMISIVDDSFHVFPQNPTTANAQFIIEKLIPLEDPVFGPLGPGGLHVQRQGLMDAPLLYANDPIDANKQSNSEVIHNMRLQLQDLQHGIEQMRLDYLQWKDIPKIQSQYDEIELKLKQEYAKFNFQLTTQQRTTISDLISSAMKMGIPLQFASPSELVKIQDKLKVQDPFQSAKYSLTEEAVKDELKKSLMEKNEMVIYDKETDSIRQFGRELICHDPNPESTLMMYTVLQLQNTSEMQSYTDAQKIRILNNSPTAIKRLKNLISKIDVIPDGQFVKQMAQAFINALEILGKECIDVIKQLRVDSTDVSNRYKYDPVDFALFTGMDESINNDQWLKLKLQHKYKLIPDIGIDPSLIDTWFDVVKMEKCIREQQNDQIPEHLRMFKYDQSMLNTLMRLAFVYKRTPLKQIVGEQYYYIKNQSMNIRRQQTTYDAQTNKVNLDWFNYDKNMLPKNVAVPAPIDNTKSLVGFNKFPNSFIKADDYLYGNQYFVQVDDFRLINISDQRQYYQIFGEQYAYVAKVHDIDPAGLVVGPVRYILVGTQALMSEVQVYAGITNSATLSLSRSIGFGTLAMTDKDSRSTQYNFSDTNQKYMQLLHLQPNINQNTIVNYQDKSQRKYVLDLGNKVGAFQQQYVTPIQFMYQVMFNDFHNAGTQLQKNDLFNYIFRILDIQPFNPTMLVKKNMPFPVIAIMDIYVQKFKGSNFGKDTYQDFNQTAYKCFNVSDDKNRKVLLLTKKRNDEWIVGSSAIVNDYTIIRQHPEGIFMYKSANVVRLTMVPAQPVANIESEEIFRAYQDECDKIDIGENAVAGLAKVQLLYSTKMEASVKTPAQRFGLPHDILKLEKYVPGFSRDAMFMNEGSSVLLAMPQAWIDLQLVAISIYGQQLEPMEKDDYQYQNIIKDLFSKLPRLCMIFNDLIRDSNINNFQDFLYNYYGKITSEAPQNDAIRKNIAASLAGGQTW